MRSGRLMYYSRHCKTGRGCSPSCGARERIPGVRPGTRRVNSWQSGRRPVVRPALAPNAITRPSKAGDEGVAGALVSTRTARITRVSSDSAQMLREFSAAPADAGMRLDRFVAVQCPELSRTRVQELITADHVRVNGKPASKGSLHLRGGEKITVEIFERPAIAARPEAIPLEVLYEDEDVIAINKPAGMTVHGGDQLRPGIVHRLDKQTSGVSLVAKNDAAHAKLGEAFQQREVKKTYLALVQGILQESIGSIELAIGRDPIHRTRMATTRKSWRGAPIANPRAARTDWRALANIANTTLVEVQLHTGRTHQIRVHFSALKHPVVGDTLYGAAAQLRLGKVVLPKLERNFLHSAKLGFAHPGTGAWIEVRAPLPGELLEFLARLCAAAGEPRSRIDAALAGYL